MECLFFFNRASKSISGWFADLFKGEGGGSRYGWYMMTKNIAKTGVFGYKIKEVEEAPLYDVMYFAMAERVEQEQQNERTSSNTRKR